MTLGDDLNAACGSAYDTGKIITNTVMLIKEAQRFVLSDEVARVCANLSYSRPSTLNAALPLCRLPYRSIWIENRGGMGEGEEKPGRPYPLRQGALVCAADRSGGQVGFISLAWVHRQRDGQMPMFGNLLPGHLAPTVCPFSIYFDWRPDGDVTELVDELHDEIDKKYGQGSGFIAMLRKTIRHQTSHVDVSIAEMQERMRTHYSMRVWADDPKEVAAVHEAQKRVQVGINPAGLAFLVEALNVAMSVSGNVEEGARRGADFMHNWLADTVGEAPFVECFLAMLNSKNPCIEQFPSDLKKLNKHRIKAGKKPFLEHINTRIALTRKQSRHAVKHGLNYDQERRGTTVMGHFKIRKTGVFWWSEHERGDQTNRVDRQHYTVV